MISDLGRYVSAASATAFILSGCGGSQTGANPASLAPAVRDVQRGTASSGPLVYVATTKAVLMLSYPQLKVVGSLPVTYAYPLVCADPNNGNVFVSESSDVVEYAHGATTPIATLTPPPGYHTLTGCSVDPTTGNLAVASEGPSGSQSAILVYAGAAGNATPYVDKFVRFFPYVAYDGAGNLFATVDAKNGPYKLAELPAGKNQFRPIKINEDLPYQVKLQWDGQYVTFLDWNGAHAGSTLYQVQVSGKYGTVVGSEQLHQTGLPPNFWIFDGAIIDPFGRVKRGNDQAVATWAYPSGGYPTSKRYGMTKGKSDQITDLTVSIAPSR